MSRIGQPLITPGDLVTLNGSQTIANKTLTSPVVSGTAGTNAGQQGYNTTDKAIYVGDGTAIQSIYTSAWKAFTPSWTNLTVGSGTNTGFYCQVGKQVTVRTSLVFGTSTAITGAVSFATPVNTNNSYVMWAGQVRLKSGGNGYIGNANVNSNAVNISVLNASATYLAVTALSSTVPGTWTTSDEINVLCCYEAA